MIKNSLGPEIFVDSDIILDLLTRREPHYFPAAKLFSYVAEKKIAAYTSSVIVANVYYVIARLTIRKKALSGIRGSIDLLKVMPVDEKTVLLALDSNFSDFEDALQYYTAKSGDISTIVTRNKTDYKVSDMTVITAEEYVKIMESQLL